MRLKHWFAFLFSVVAFGPASIESSFAQEKASPDAIAKAVTPEPQKDDWAQSWWMPRHEEKKKEVAARKDVQLVWIGDSITHGWEGEGKEIWEEKFGIYKPLNLGFSGDRTEQVLWRLKNGEIEGLKPRAFVIMIGTNNTGHRQDPAEATAAGIKAILDLLSDTNPTSQILLLAIFPREEKNSGALRQINHAINEKIIKFSDGKRIHFMDVGPGFLDDDGNLKKELMPDFLHPNKKGYGVWAEAVESKIEELMTEPKK